MTKKYLFYISQNYSFEILRPIQKELWNRQIKVMWLVVGDEVNHDYFTEDEVVEYSIDKAREFKPDACFVPGNNIPNFISGLKVQVFHGLEWKKKGHFVIRGFFDLYCTHGPATTDRFNKLANQHQYFDVVETGWPKLDLLFSAPAFTQCPPDKKTILYAPTFSPALTSVPALYQEISSLIQNKNYHWLVKFHPKMDKSWVEKYQALSCDNFQVIETPVLNNILQRADIMLSDTSSVIGEFALLNKPVITFKNSQPGDYLIDIDDTSQLADAIEQAFKPNALLLAAIKQYAQQLHPYNDGKSAHRIIDAVESILQKGKQAKKNKPWNIFRNLKTRKSLSYWKL